MITRVELLAGVLALLTLFFAWYHHHLIAEGETIGRAEVVAADKAAVARQKTIDDKKLGDAHAAHEKEMVDLAGLYGNGGELRIVRNYVTPSTYAKAELPLGQCPAGGVVLGDAQLYRDRLEALRVFAGIGDTLAAGCRELNSATH